LKNSEISAVVQGSSGDADMMAFAMIEWLKSDGVAGTAYAIARVDYNVVRYVVRYVGMLEQARSRA